LLTMKKFFAQYHMFNFSPGDSCMHRDSISFAILLILTRSG
jgi:hypothetical protein